MRGRIRWLDTETKKQRERREQQYERQMFPLGAEQKQAELLLLGQVVTSVKPQDALYQLLQVREIILGTEAGEEREEQLADWRRGFLARRLSAKEAKLLIRLVPRIGECKSMDDFPTADEVRGWKSGD